MKAKLIYNLPEEEKEHRRAVMSLDLALALWDIGEYLRGVDKWDTGDDIEKIRKRFYEILEEYDINIDHLIE